MDEHVPSASAVQGVYRARLVAMKMPLRRLGREEVEYRRRGIAGLIIVGGDGLVVSLGSGRVGGDERVRDEERVTVCFGEVAAFDVGL